MPSASGRPRAETCPVQDATASSARGTRLATCVALDEQLARETARCPPSARRNTATDAANGAANSSATGRDPAAAPRAARSALAGTRDRTGPLRCGIWESPSGFGWQRSRWPAGRAICAALGSRAERWSSSACGDTAACAHRAFPIPATDILGVDDARIRHRRGRMPRTVSRSSVADSMFIAQGPGVGSKSVITTARRMWGFFCRAAQLLHHLVCLTSPALFGPDSCTTDTMACDTPGILAVPYPRLGAVSSRNPCGAIHSRYMRQRSHSSCPGKSAACDGLVDIRGTTRRSLQGVQREAGSPCSARATAGLQPIRILILTKSRLECFFINMPCGAHTASACEMKECLRPTIRLDGAVVDVADEV